MDDKLKVRDLIDAENGTVKPAIYTDVAIYELEAGCVFCAVLAASPMKA